MNDNLAQTCSGTIIGEQVDLGEPHPFERAVNMLGQVHVALGQVASTADFIRAQVIGGTGLALLVAVQIVTGKRRQGHQGKSNIMYGKWTTHDSLLFEARAAETIITGVIISEVCFHARTFTWPVAPSTRRRWPVRRRRWASGKPATAGRPNSRATIAPCDSTPPVSMTKAWARMKSGTQAGSVEGQTRIKGSAGRFPVD